MRQRWSVCALAVAAALGPASACKKNSSSEQPPPPDDQGQGQADDVSPAPGPSKPPPGPTGTISGQVVLVGTPPEMPLLQRGSDAVCARKEMHAETIVTGPGGALENVVVRVKPGAVPGWIPTTPVVVDQKDCMYRPRVQGAVRGQLLVIKNSDQTAHNVHGRRVPWGKRRDVETVFNRAQPPGSPDLKGRIRDDDILKLKCDQHGWMQGYLLVSDNPYFATSGNDGHFTIENAPVGTYELQAWHEFYGVKTATVTVEAGKTATVNFSYDADKDKPASAGEAGGAAGGGR